jgi:hypothetical protein
LKPHRGARHRGFAEIERRAVAADPAAQHDQAVLRLAQVLMLRNRERRQVVRDLGRVGMREHRHRRLAPRLPRTFAFGFAARHLIGLAGLKLSMILDNLIMKRHDCFVTRQ